MQLIELASKQHRIRSLLIDSKIQGTSAIRHVRNAQEKRERDRSVSSYLVPDACSLSQPLNQPYVVPYSIKSYLQLFAKGKRIGYRTLMLQTRPARTPRSMTLTRSLFVRSDPPKFTLLINTHPIPPLPMSTRLRLRHHLLLLNLLLLLLLLHPQSTQIRKPRMHQTLLRTGAHLRPQLQHPPQQIQARGINLRQDQAQLLRIVDVEVGFVFRVGCYAWPGALGGCAHQAEDLLELVLVGGAGEQGAAGVHLGHDAACAPDVDASVVGAGAKEDVGGAVPEGDDLVGEGVDGDAEGAGEAEVGEFELALGVDEEVLGLQVAVEDAVVVAEGDALEELMHEGFTGDEVQAAAIAAGIHVLLEVFVHVFEDEHEFVFGVDDVVERDNVFVLELFHEGDFADGGGGGAFFAVEVDFFEGDELAGLAVAAFEDLVVSC